MGGIELQCRICASPDSFQPSIVRSSASCPALVAQSSALSGRFDESEWAAPAPDNHQISESNGDKLAGRRSKKSVIECDVPSRPAEPSDEAAKYMALDTISCALLLLHQRMLGTNDKTWPGRHSTHTSLRTTVVQPNWNGRLPNPNGTCRHFTLPKV